MTDCNCNHFSLAGGTSVVFDAGVSVGIGTSSPEEPLHVVGQALIAGLNARLVLGRSDGTDPAASKTWQLDNSNNDLRLYQQPTLTTVGTVYMTIKDGGNVGIGMTTPGDRLVVEDSSTDRVRLSVRNANNQTAAGSTSRSAELMFSGYDPAGTTLRATFELGTDAELDGTQSLYAYDTVAGAYRLYLGPTGNLGIGTTTPTTERLVVAGGGVDLTAPALNPTANTGLGLSYESYGGRIQSFQSRPLILNPLGNNVGIGKTSPAQPLDVNGNISTNASLLASGRKVADGNGCYYA